MKECKCRFVSEYKNFRINRLKDDIRFYQKHIAYSDPEGTKERVAILESQIDRIEKYYSACKCGLVSVDECMYKISEVGSYHDPDYYDIP